MLEGIVRGQRAAVVPGAPVPDEVTSYCVWLCFRFPLSFR